MKILVQFPTFRRPEKFLKCFAEWLELASGLNHLFFNINCDMMDETMHNEEMLQAISRLLSEHDKYAQGYVFMERDSDKISAINANIEQRDFDIVICASDDMVPQVLGWDLKISEAMKTYFPDLDGALHFNDGYQGNKLITLSVMGRKLYERFGYIYHPDYKSLYCDNEFTQEVYRLEKVQYLDEVIIKHEHYGEKDNSNTGHLDESASKTLRYAGRDGAVFAERKRLGFPKERITSD